jgi:uncharacterized membrane protein (DUF485 family)
MGKDYGTEFKTRLGIMLFFFYALIYAGFVGINLVNAKLMETIVLWGMNLAVVYGFSLIILALVMALIYTRICSWKENQLKTIDENANENKEVI